MKLVKKETSKHELERILSLTEREAIMHNQSGSLTPSKSDNLVASAILEEMDKKELLLECDCLEEGTGKPYNCEVKKRFLRHLPTSVAHASDCPLYRSGSNSHKETTEREEKTRPLNPVGGDDWLPDQEKENQSATRQPSVEKRQQRKTALKPVPALGRKLLTLLETAGINQCELVPTHTKPGLKHAIEKVKNVLTTTTMSNGIPLSDIISCSTWLSETEIGEQLVKLETNDVIQRDKKKSCFFLIGLTKTVSNDEVTFRIKGKDYSHKPAKRIKINGENSYNAGSRGPYWVIIEFRKDKENKTFCNEGYAHAAHDMDDPIPVDSNKERETLNAIYSAGKYINEQENCPAATSLKKPLFTMRCGENEEIIHPDFILTVIPKGAQQAFTLIIETMGYSLPEYVERKSRTHPLMENVGTLLTDPPNWPGKPTVTFNSLLLAHLFKR